MKKTTDENREFGSSLGSGKKGRGGKFPAPREFWYVQVTGFESKVLSLLYCHSLTPHKLSG